MHINKINRTPVGADYVDEQNHPAICRGRFIAPSADLSAFGGWSGIQFILLKAIIAPSADLSALAACSDLQLFR
jgi:hypothetical protein